MLIVDKVLVSEDLLDECFCCDLGKCHGICCIEGDVGAPIDPDEVGDMEDCYPAAKKYMTKEAIELVDNLGTFDYDMEGEFVTPLVSDEACAYVFYEEGVAKCALERAYFNGETDFRKPISCHLYPIRIKKLPEYEALNYHRWDVCKDACENGQKMKLPVYQFLREPLIRKYGEEWYAKLEEEVKKRKG